MKIMYLCLLSLILSGFLLIEASITCRDQNGKPVDWFIAYKMPHQRDRTQSLLDSGHGFYYMDVNNPYWTESQVPINQTDQAIGYTLAQIYTNGNSTDVMYFMYNDEVADLNQTSSSYGHTKGDVCFDKTSGFWLVHSIPKFPPHVSNGYSYPSTGMRFAQTLLCVSYNYSQLNNIGEQFLFNYPQVYQDFNLPESFAKENPNIEAVVNNKHVSGSPWSHIVQLESLAGQQFTSFAKFTKFGADLYGDLVAPYLKDNLYVESWMHGPGTLDTNCSLPFKVYKTMRLNVSGTEFSSGEDHAKWAVTAQQTWTCVGDINRQSSQFHRGGGTVCMNLTTVWKMFRGTIAEYDPCPKYTNRSTALFTGGLHRMQNRL